MGMCQKRCPKCKKKRRFVDQNLETWSKKPINPLTDQQKHDAGWRYVEDVRICGYCSWRMNNENINNSISS